MVPVLERAVERMLPSSGWDTFLFFLLCLFRKSFCSYLMLVLSCDVWRHDTLLLAIVLGSSAVTVEHGAGGVCSLEYGAGGVCPLEYGAGGVCSLEHGAGGVCSLEYGAGGVCSLEHGAGGVCSLNIISNSPFLLPVSPLPPLPLAPPSPSPTPPLFCLLILCCRQSL